MLRRIKALNLIPRAKEFGAFLNAKGGITLSALRGHTDTVRKTVAIFDSALGGSTRKLVTGTAGDTVIFMVARHLGRKIGIKADPILGAGFAFRDTFISARDGRKYHAIASGAEGALYTIATISGTFAVLDFWNPAGWGAATIATVSGAAAFTLTTGKAVHASLGPVTQWYDRWKNNDVQNPRTTKNPPAFSAGDV